jgi:hypothetical protein
MAENEKYRQPSREGQVSFTFWTTPERKNNVKRLAIDTGRKVHELMEEATDDLLAKHAKRGKRKG